MAVDRTFLFTDIEGSTRKWEEHAPVMTTALARHDDVISRAVISYGGAIVKHTGDGFLAVFTDPASALTAATDAQRELAAVPPNVVEPLRVRMGVHRGEAEPMGTDFMGPTLNRCARLMAVAHGGQVVLSESVVAAIGETAASYDLVDLGIHQLRDVLEPVQVFQLSIDGLESEFPPLKTVGKSQHNLPEPVSSFIGRVKMLEQVEEMLSRRRLVTLVGAGGSGKTRLAIEAAAARVMQHPDGAWLVELADVSSGDAVAGAVALGLRVQEDLGRSIADTLCARLERSDLLLVLDNCEHVVTDVAELATRLLRSCPRVRILATSREPLGVAGEALLAIDPLEVPTSDLSSDAGAESVQLFIDRAVLVRPDFSPVGDELSAVTRLCRKLEGIPLAIELAAARLNVLSVTQLEQLLDRRFALLTGTLHRTPRHRTLRATVEWSYDLLDEAEQNAWAALAIFVGGFDLAAAAFVLDVEQLDALDLVSSLVNRSILGTVAATGGDLRYRMLETMREFGREKLVEADALRSVRARQRAWALKLAAQAEPEHMTNSGPPWHNRLDLEYPNLRLAIESGLEDGASEESLRLCADLGIFFWLRGHLADGRDWCERSLAAAVDADAGLRARGVLSLGELAFGQVDFDAAGTALEEAVAIARSVGDEVTVGWAKQFLAVIHASRGDAHNANAASDEALRIAERYVIPSVRAGAYYWVGAVAATLGQDAKAAHYLEASVDLAREVGSPYTLARFLPLIARRLHASGDHSTAIVTFEEAIDVARSAGDRVGLARSLQYMAEHHIRSGEYELAAACLEEAKPIVSREIDDPALASRVELSSATLWRHRGNALRAQAHLDRALAWAGRLQGWRSSMDPYFVEAEMAIDRGDAQSALAALDRSKRFARQSRHDERLARALLLEARVVAALGRTEEADALIAEAEGVFGKSEDPVVSASLDHARGCAALAHGSADEAVAALRRAVDTATKGGAVLLAIECKEDLALALASVDPDGPEPIELVADASAERESLGTPRPAPRATALARLVSARPDTEENTRRTGT